jgi:hypothetical protein
MSSMESPDAINRKMDLVKSVWEAIRTHLENAKNQLYEQIRNYPRPIPACDQHFNYLLQERTRILRELGRMDGAFQESLTRTDSLELIDAFIKSSSYLGGDAGQRIRSSLKERLSTLET